MLRVYFVGVSGIACSVVWVGCVVCCTFCVITGACVCSVLCRFSLFVDYVLCVMLVACYLKYVVFNRMRVEYVVFLLRVA